MILPNETTTQDNAVEDLFCKKFEGLERYPMNSDDSEFLIRLLGSKKTSLKDCPLNEDEKPFVYKVIEKRVEHFFTFKINDSRLVFFLAIITKSAGTAVMYLSYIQYWCKKNDIKEIDLDIFCDEIFPFGFPKEDDLKELWYSLKVLSKEGGSGSLLDYHTAHKSIQFLD